MTVDTESPTTNPAIVKFVPEHPPTPEFNAFRSLAAKLVSVPKSEVDEKRAKG